MIFLYSYAVKRPRIINYFLKYSLEYYELNKNMDSATYVAEASFIPANLNTFSESN